MLSPKLVKSTISGYIMELYGNLGYSKKSKKVKPKIQEHAFKCNFNTLEYTFLDLGLNIFLINITTIILVEDSFFQFTIKKPTAQAFMNTLTFDHFLFNSSSSFHVNLVYVLGHGGMKVG